MASIKRKFKVKLRDGNWWYGGYANFSRTGNAYTKLRHTSLYCSTCDEIWCRVHWEFAEGQRSNLVHVPCENHGAGFILPMQVPNCQELEFPIEVLRRDFLLIMEKKSGESQVLI